MDLNIITISYLFFRLAPFILVCFFTLASFFNQDFKGIIYLVGLIFACFMSIIIGKTGFFDFLDISIDARSEVCNTFSIQNIGLIDKSLLPIGQVVFGYTLFYLGTAIFYTDSFLNNLPTLIFFPAISVMDMLWNSSNNCYGIGKSFISFAIGSGIGIGWAYLLNWGKAKDLLYFNNISGKKECSRPTKNTFKCRVYKNGQLVQNISPKQRSIQPTPKQRSIQPTEQP